MYKVIEVEPWGTPYRTVMKKIGGRPAVPLNLIPDIVRELFPQHEEPTRPTRAAVTCVPTLTTQELATACRKF